MLLAGLIHAGWNILAKKTGGDARFAFFTSAWQMAVWAPLGLWLAWRAVPAWGAAEWAVIGASALLHVVYFVTLLRGYRQNVRHIVFAFHDDHHLRDQPVEAGIGAPGQ